MNLTPELNLFAFTVYNGFSVPSYFVQHAIIQGSIKIYFNFGNLLLFLSQLSFGTQKIRKQKTVINMRS